VDQDVSAIQGGAAYVSDIERRLAPYFERAEPRQRAMAYLRGLLSPAERKNSWQLAEVSGDATPYAFQHLLRRALWDPEAVRDELRRYVIQYLGASNAVLGIDETGFLKKGHQSAGVARQYSGTAGKVDNCQIGVFLAYASRLGYTLLDRELYLPKEWANDPPRCRQAGIPEDRRCTTKPQLAQPMLARACTAGVPAQWVTGDSVYGADRRLRMWLEAQPQAYVLAGRAATPGQDEPGRPGGGGLDAAQCRRWYQGSAVVRLALATVGRAPGAGLAPLAAGAAPCERSDRPDRLCGLCPPSDHLGSRRAGSRHTVDG
jgi:SRSO17 transposase